MENNIILDVKKLNTSFVSDGKEIKILKDVSFQLKRGSTLAVVGESGCGKSVTVHSVVKLLPKNAITKAESIKYIRKTDKGYQEFELNNLKPYGKEMRSLRGNDIGMVFQDPMSSLNPVHKVGAQVAEGLREHNKKLKKEEAQKQVLEMFKKLSIPDPDNRINNYPFEFSGGMKQRVVIALAMICDPNILIADEPTTALDVTIQAQIMELMKKLQLEMNKSIILITHNMGLVAEMADDIAVMYMGRIVEFGSLEDIFNNPSHPYTQALLRSVPVLGLSKDEELATIPGSTPNPANLIEGCEFAERCDFCQDECKKGLIPAFEVSKGHKVRCLRYKTYEKVD